MSGWNSCTSLLKLRTQLLLQRPMPLLFYLETSFYFVEPSSVPYCGGSLDRKWWWKCCFHEWAKHIHTVNVFILFVNLGPELLSGPQLRTLWSISHHLVQSSKLICLEYKSENASFLLDLSYRLGLTFTWKLQALRIKVRFFLSPLRSSVASLTRCPVHHTSLSSQSSGPMGLFSAHVLLLPALDLRYPAPHPPPQTTLFHPSELRLKSLAFSWPQKRLIPTLCYPPISCAIFLCSIYHITTVINFIIDASVSTSPNQMYVLGRHVELCHEHRRYAVNTVQTNEFRSINMDNIYNI